MTTEQHQDALLHRLLEEHTTDPHRGIEGARLRLHVAVHAVVEQQVLEGAPAVTARTLSRLIAEGLTRHQAVHAIGAVASEEVLSAMAEGGQYDEQRYAQRLESLSAASVVEEQESEES